MANLQYGLKIWEVEPQSMQAEAHRHNDIELIYIERGTISYLYHAETLTLRAGDMMVFWATIPHQLLDVQDHCIMHIITIPLAQVIAWELAPTFLENLMNGKPIMQNRVFNNKQISQTLLRQWQRDLQMASTERREIVLLELQALLKRWCLYLNVEKEGNIPTQTYHSSTTLHAQTMARYIAENYTQALTLDEIAQTAGINPSYASSIFAQELNINLWDYLTQYRVAHAQRLLLLTDSPIPAIAEASGFTSTSQFYAIFKKHCQQSPKQFRLSVQ